MDEKLNHHLAEEFNRLQGESNESLMGRLTHDCPQCGEPQPAVSGATTHARILKHVSRWTTCDRCIKKERRMKGVLAPADEGFAEHSQTLSYKLNCLRFRFWAWRRRSFRRALACLRREVSS